MSNKIFEELFSEKIEIFKNSYTNISKNLFYDEVSNKIIHNGEYGTYREAVTREFLRPFIPNNLDISTGFLINTCDEVSTQCDIVIYEPKMTPLVQTSELQRFFPVESVASIGEIKSNLKKHELKAAINKLASNKSLRQNY